MIRAEKQKFVDTLRGEFSQVRNAFLLGYKGLNVAQVNALRQQVRNTSSKIKVVKNRLAARATADTPLTTLAPHFKGPLALAYNSGEPAALAKVLVEFARGNPQLVFRAGVAEARDIDAAAFQTLAALPSREILLSQLLGLLKSPQQRLLAALSAITRNLAVVLRQVESIKSKQAPQ
ncbi:MAG: 50S ribosomal protein L10 [Acidobacteriota bacterium]